MEIIGIKDWEVVDWKGEVPFLIAGPCSAETPGQVLGSCEGAAARGAHLLRAGIWKPRTRPGSFQGVGKQGLPWLMEARARTGRPVTVEVASGQHVEVAMKAGVDVLWIGARSSANPFTVQEIADALRGVDVPVLVKNPVNPDLELWIGAVERIYQAGIKRIALIHRGFSTYKSAPYRNAPMWQIPIEMRRRHPELEIICDPSHICGSRHLLSEVSQQALDLDFDGLMIETHIHPGEAWSDAAQQVTPDGLAQLLKQLITRYSDSSDPDFMANLEALRYDIDRLDHEIIDLLAKRMMVSSEIGKYKKQKDVTILQLNRWSKIFDSRVKYTISTGLSPEFASNFIQSIHNESIRQQMKVMEVNEVKKPVRPPADEK